MKNNVIQFPGQCPIPQSNVPIIGQQDREENNPAIVLDRATKNKKKGLMDLANRVDSIDKPRPQSYEPYIEDRFRDLEGAARAAYLSIEGISIILDAVISDFINMLRTLDHQAAAHFQSSTHLQALLNVLKAKGAISDDDLKPEFEKIIAVQMEKLKEPAE